MPSRTYDWQAERERADSLFGDTPGDTLEAALLLHFTDHPGRVHQLITTIGNRVAQGKIHSGWPILLKELERTPPNVTASDDGEREKATTLVEKWIANTGGYYSTTDEHGNETHTELLDTIFGIHGRLYRWRDDTDLTSRILECWHEHRPRFTQAEQESEQRARQRVELRQRLRNATVTAHEPDADTHAELIARAIENARDGQPLDLSYLDTIIDTRECEDAA